MLVESRFIFICNSPPPTPHPQPRPPPFLLIHTKTIFLIITNIVGAHWNCYSSWIGVWRNLWSASFLSGRWQRRGINVRGSLNYWPCIFWPLLCRIRIYGVCGQPLLQWSTTESQGLNQKFPSTICTSHSIHRKNIHFDFGKINML